MELFQFGIEVLKRLDGIAERLDLLLKQQSGKQGVLAAQTEPGTPVTNRKNQVSDKKYREKAPVMIQLLLREGCRTTGLRVPSLASELGVSGSTVTRIARRLAEDEGLIYLVPNSGVGGMGTLIKITNRRYEEAEQWAKGIEQ